MDGVKRAGAPEEWLWFARQKQMPGVGLCDCLGESAPNTTGFWTEFALFLHEKAFHWDALAAWDRALRLVEADKKFDLLMTACRKCAVAGLDESITAGFATRAVWITPNDYHSLMETGAEHAAVCTKAANVFFAQAARIAPNKTAPLLWLALLSAGEQQSLHFVEQALITRGGRDLNWKPIHDKLNGRRVNDICRVVNWEEFGDVCLVRGLETKTFNAYAQAIRFSTSPTEASATVELKLYEAGFLPPVKNTETIQPSEQWNT